jgi:putative transposase
MAHTYSRILIHMVFATKERLPLITPELRPKLHAYMAGVCRQSNCHVYALDGVADHVHIVFDLSRTHSVADFANRLKSASSKWAKREGGVHGFGWQRGYGAFSMNQESLDRAVRYVEGQQEHHRRRTLGEELAEFMRLHGMESDDEFIEGVYRNPEG